MNEKSFGQGLSLFQAARYFDIPFDKEIHPVDGEAIINDLKFHYLEWGDRDNETILLLHGIAQQSHSWDLISLALSHRYHVIAMDSRGHGDTGWPGNRDYSLESHQADIYEFTKVLGLDRFILIGHSMGGRNGYIFASQRPDLVKALVIVDTGPDGSSSSMRRIRQFISLPDELDSYEEFADRVQKYTGRPLWLIHGSLKHSIRRLPNGKWTWKYDKAIRSPGFDPHIYSRRQLWRYLEEIECPVLIIRGELSDVFRQETMEQMLQTMRNSRGVVIPDAGHLVPGDNPKLFLETLTSFLTELKYN